MNAPKNARLTPHSRTALVRGVLEDGQTPKAAVAAFGTCPKIVAKWVARFRAEGIAGLRNRPSRSHKLRNSALESDTCRIEALRYQRWTGHWIVAEPGALLSTASRILHRLGLSRIKDFEPFPLPGTACRWRTPDNPYMQYALCSGCTNH